jgi:hypothetical protein
MRIINLRGIVLTVSCFVVLSCKEKHPSPSPALISALELKRGQLISCGPSEQQFGSLSCARTRTPPPPPPDTLGLNLQHYYE